GSLRALGLGRADRVAMVLPNGPEMAALFLAVASGAAAAPLNAAYREEEFDFYISDIEAKLLLIEAGLDSPARAVAARRGIPVVEVAPDTAQPAGRYALLKEGKPVPAGSGEPNGSEDVALVPHPSGPPPRPTSVPPPPGTLPASARNIGRTLALRPQDRCLVIMPLFHIHGLVGGLSSSMAAGASVYCPPGFNALKFFHWL